MYNPPAFREERTEVLHRAIRAAGMAILVTSGPDGLMASHIPMLLDPDAGEFGTLYGHVARANPQARATGQALAIFQGPDAYVTPSWYPSKQVDGKVVPTWNYVAVHAMGVLETFDDPARLLDIVTRLTERFEGAREKPWAVSDAPEDYVAGMLKGITGFVLPIAKLEGKWKMSQNRVPGDRAGVVAGLTADGRDDIAGLIAR
ncbi:MAG: FMN-binding negative transcriptional regulator [Acetobacteraceae bacterium]|nr:FMN-binding negative transcriptional regulator [Acetobacteraceae bacterium]MSP30793.1 FMN-binding negative transcriptional regulator [Acetobacteraceae bacterium]